MAARLASSSCSCFFEGLDCVEGVLVVGFKPGMVSLEGVRAEVGIGCRADEGVDGLVVAGHVVLGYFSFVAFGGFG